MIGLITTFGFNNANIERFSYDVKKMHSYAVPDVRSAEEIVTCALGLNDVCAKSGAGCLVWGRKRDPDVS